MHRLVDSVAYFIIGILSFFQDGLRTTTTSEQPNPHPQHRSSMGVNVDTIEGMILTLSCGNVAMEGVISCFQWSISLCQTHDIEVTNRSRYCAGTVLK